MRLLRARRDLARDQVTQLARIADALERIIDRRNVEMLNREFVTAANARRNRRLTEQEGGDR